MWSIWFQFLGHVSRSPELRRIFEGTYAGWRARLAGILTGCIAAGQMPPVDPELTAKQLSGMIDGLALSCIYQDPAMSPEEMRRVCLRFVADLTTSR